MTSSPLWNGSNSSPNGISNHQPNNNAGTSNANGNTNASANRSVWNGGGQDRPPSSVGHSPKMDANPQNQQQHYQNDPNSLNCNNTSPVNSRLKTMILNKQQQQYNQQLHQYNQQMYGQQQMLSSPSGDGGGSQMISPQLSSDQFGQVSHDSRPPSRQSPNPSQNSTGHFLVEGHHLQRSVIPEGGGIWEWGEDIQRVSGMESFEKYVDTAGNTDDECRKLLPGEHLGFQNMKDSTLKKESKFGKKFFHDTNIKNTRQSKMSNEDPYFHTETMTVYDDEFGDVNIKEEPYLFRGDGGPMLLKKTSGAWCCRQGGTDNPSPDHLRDGCCPGQGLQTLDEVVESEPEKPLESKNVSRLSHIFTNVCGFLSPH